MVKPTVVASVSDLIAHYDLFLFDQYGVLHDGVNSYPGMQHCLSLIKSAGKPIGVISNSGKRSAYNTERLTRFGFGADMVDAVVSSGEVAWNYLHNHLQQSDSHKVLYLGRGEDRSAIAGLPLQECKQPAESDVVLLCGCEPEQFALHHYNDWLLPAAQRRVPMYCTNPDRWSLVNSQRVYGPAQVAEIYEALGGEVIWIGKPYAEIYEYTLRLFGVEGSRVLCIGDSVEHDIAGATAAGCHSLLTRTGILAGNTELELQAHFQRHKATPQYMIQRETL